MKRNLWMNLMMAVLVAGLFMTVSCAKKTMVTEPTTIEDQAAEDANAAEAAKAAKVAAEAEKLKQQEIQEQMLQEKMARKAAAKKRFINQNIHFEYDSAKLSSMAKMLIREKAAWLKANTGVSVIIEGHCDERGTTVYNLALGERRAGAVKNYLVDLGVSDARLQMVSFGEEKPLDPAKTEAAYRKNRRAQFVLK